MNGFFTYRQVPESALRVMSRFLAVTMLCCLALSTRVSAQQPSDVPLTNAAVVKLVRAGFKDKTVIAIIHSRPNRFNLDTEQLIQLKHSGVSENIVLAMLSQDESIGMGDDWSNDTFFKGNNKRSIETGPADSQDSGTGIFGSSGGSRSQTRSRGQNGSAQNEGTTTGSATVRILRPPTEGGGSSPKLERTPTLDNEAIIRLVEAGFSEGTIIKRIEESPAEFDLSPAKLADLHKRRVTDSIIAAMTAAMGGKESENKANAPLQDREK
jgi:hypothetical protein